jgi:hypothetical protein
MVYRRERVYRTEFRNLPFGATYYLGSGRTVTGPFVKNGRHIRLDTDEIPQVDLSDAVADSTVAVIRVDKVFRSTQQPV